MVGKEKGLQRCFLFVWRLQRCAELRNETLNSRWPLWRITQLASSCRNPIVSSLNTWEIQFGPYYRWLERLPNNPLRLFRNLYRELGLNLKAKMELITLKISGYSIRWPDPMEVGRTLKFFPRCPSWHLDWPGSGKQQNPLRRHVVHRHLPHPNVRDLLSDI